jgi:hypothetical protein
MAINHYIFFTQESYAESPNDSWILGYEHGNTPEAARKRFIANYRWILDGGFNVEMIKWNELSR